MFMCNDCTQKKVATRLPEHNNAIKCHDPQKLLTNHADKHIVPYIQVTNTKLLGHAKTRQAIQRGVAHVQHKPRDIQQTLTSPLLTNNYDVAKTQGETPLNLTLHNKLRQKLWSIDQQTRRGRNDQHVMKFQMNNLTSTTCQHARSCPFLFDMLHITHHSLARTLILHSIKNLRPYQVI